MSLNEDTFDGLPPLIIKLLVQQQPEVLLLPGIVNKSVIIAEEGNDISMFDLFWTGLAVPTELQSGFLRTYFADCFRVWLSRQDYTLQDLYDRHIP